MKLAKSEFMPNLALMGGIDYSNGIELAGKKLLNKGSGYVAVTLNVPILTFGERTNKIRSAKAKHQLAELEEQDLHEKMQLELTQCQNNFNEAQTELHLALHHIEQSKWKIEHQSATLQHILLIVESDTCPTFPTQEHTRSIYLNSLIGHRHLIIPIPDKTHIVD